ncbi:MAG: hypothetical protein V4638_00995 [Bacteroidota bacterium]
MKKFVLLLLSGAFALQSCQPKETDFEESLGDIDATAVIAIGGGYMAGELDGALTYEGQKNSLAAMISGQFASNSFLQPLMDPSSVGIGFTGGSVLDLDYKTDCTGATSLSPVRVAATGDATQLANMYAGPYANMGVLGMKSTHLVATGYGNSAAGAGNYNPFFSRMAANEASSSVIADALANNPTFFSFFVGMEDVFQYAQKGATGSLTPINGAAGVGFDGSISTALDQLTANGAKGVVGTIPDVTSMPYFTTIPWNGLNLDQADADLLNNIYNPIGISFQVGVNAFMIQDPDAGAFGVRKMVEGELIVLGVPLDSVKCNQMGSAFPFRNEFVLTLEEIQEIRDYTNSYNAILAEEASSHNLALADVHSFFAKIKAGFVWNGVSISSTFVSGGAYALDGYSLVPRTNALLANEFIKAINTQYHSTIRLLNPSVYRGVIFP